MVVCSVWLIYKDFSSVNQKTREIPQFLQDDFSIGGKIFQSGSSPIDTFSTRFSDMDYDPDVFNSPATDEFSTSTSVGRTNVCAYGSRRRWHDQFGMQKCKVYLTVIKDLQMTLKCKLLTFDKGMSDLKSSFWKDGSRIADKVLLLNLWKSLNSV